MSASRILQAILALGLALSSLLLHAGAREECEDWARNDNISAMRWDRYVDACIESMQGEGEEPALEEDEPTPTASPRPLVDRAY